MKILSIETSCDETAVSIIDAKGTVLNPEFKILGNALYSQAKLHEKYGGVYPNLAKREHQKNLVPLLRLALKEARFFKLKVKSEKLKVKVTQIQKILEREPELLEQFLKFLPTVKRPRIDAIAVTEGPGLEPALWVGINFAKALSTYWNISLIPVNHMEGHFLSVLYSGKEKFEIKYPALALLISGGHTELVYAKKPLSYKVIGRTRDDAVGETYDKVARMLSLPYPGGPKISSLANKARKLKMKNEKSKIKLPRPMINSKDFDFSFSGLKTAVLYSIKDRKLKTQEKIALALEFENAIRDVLISKSKKAILKFKSRTFIVAGGVIANQFLRKEFEKLIKNYPKIKLLIPLKELSTDNSIMIGIAGYLKYLSGKKFKNSEKIKGSGNLSL